jgi:multiple sugar transport system permease protein
MLALFLLPGLAGLLVFYLIPFVYGFYFSVTDGTRLNEYVGFSNYLRVWQNPMFQQGLLTTMELSLLCAPIIFVLAFAIAGMLRSLGQSSAFYRNALLLPYLMPSSAMILIWLLIFDYSGVFNQLLMDVLGLGIERPVWTSGPLLRLPVILLYVWKNLGFSVVIFTSALQAVPQAYYEYASLEGASRVNQELRITLPLISPTAFLVFVLAWINAFKIFKEIFFIGGAYSDLYTLQHFMNNHFARIQCTNNGSTNNCTLYTVICTLFTGGLDCNDVPIRFLRSRHRPARHRLQ